MPISANFLYILIGSGLGLFLVVIGLMLGRRLNRETVVGSGEVGDGDTEQILQMLEEDPSIQYFVLAAGSDKDSPGPLVNTFSGSLIGAMPIPVVIVPGHLSLDQIAQIA